MTNSTINLNLKRQRPKNVNPKDVRVRLTPDAYNYLWDIYEQCEGGSLTQIASTIIVQAVEKDMIRFLSEEGE